MSIVEKSSLCLQTYATIAKRIREDLLASATKYQGNLSEEVARNKAQELALQGFERCSSELKAEFPGYEQDRDYKVLVPRMIDSSQDYFLKVSNEIRNLLMSSAERPKFSGWSS